jgi:glycosyltransferase involved in cell wall biosynthesis
LKGIDLETALAEADVLVLPSWAEGLPNAMVEAMAARLAVVVTAVGNIPDVVTDGREALLVPPRNVSALKAALARVIEDPVLRRNLGDAAFSLAASRWDVEQAVEGMLQAMASSTRNLQSA